MYRVFHSCVFFFNYFLLSVESYHINHTHYKYSPTTLDYFLEITELYYYSYSTLVLINFPKGSDQFYRDVLIETNYTFLINIPDKWIPKESNLLIYSTMLESNHYLERFHYKNRIIFFSRQNTSEKDWVEEDIDWQRMRDSHENGNEALFLFETVEQGEIQLGLWTYQPSVNPRALVDTTFSFEEYFNKKPDLNKKNIKISGYYNEKITGAKMCLIFSYVLDDWNARENNKGKPDIKIALQPILNPNFDDTYSVMSISCILKRLTFFLFFTLMLCRYWVGYA